MKQNTLLDDYPLKKKRKPETKFDPARKNKKYYEKHYDANSYHFDDELERHRSK